MEFKAKEFRKDVITKRIIEDNISVLEACEEIKITEDELLKIENMTNILEINIDTFIKVCNWLGIKNPDKYLINVVTRQEGFNYIGQRII